jgi:hypothetical protein
MIKSKKILGLLCALGLTIGSGTVVYADADDEVSGYLPSCGDLWGFSASFIEGPKYVKSDTCTRYDAYKIQTNMTAVNRNTGDTVASGSDYDYNTTCITVTRSVSTSISVTVFGSHQVWGTGSEYWGKYTTVYD